MVEIGSPNVLDVIASGETVCLPYVDQSVNVAADLFLLAETPKQMETAGSVYRATMEIIVSKAMEAVNKRIQ